MKKAASTQQDKARLRAEVIMKVRCGLLTAQQAAEHLGVSRKTYYKWEERGLCALLSNLADQSSGRPCRPVESEKQALERQLEQARRECAILKHKMALKDVLTELKLTPGMSRVEKKRAHRAGAHHDHRSQNTIRSAYPQPGSGDGASPGGPETLAAADQPGTGGYRSTRPAKGQGAELKRAQGTD